MDNVHGGNVHHIYLEESTGQLQKKKRRKKLNTCIYHL